MMVMISCSVSNCPSGKVPAAARNISVVYLGYSGSVYAETIRRALYGWAKEDMIPVYTTTHVSLWRFWHGLHGHAPMLRV